ncbi:Tyrosine recombinase XerC [Aquabacterium sp. CECT 9606]|nr:Tyrosine recombinase XerC [Aquabacterium sp. CECT 9606]
MLEPQSTTAKAPRLLDDVRDRIRSMHYSIRTEEAYLYWIKGYIRFHALRHPKDMGQAELEAYLAWLANERQVSASTHKQALSALLFLYRQVLRMDFPWLAEIGRPKATRRLPVVLSPEEVAAVLQAIDPSHRLIGQTLYGTGLRLMEGLRLRVKDVDFAHQTIVVREGKGAKDRVVMLPAKLADPLRIQLRASRAMWEADRASVSVQPSHLDPSASP